MVACFDVWLHRATINVTHLLLLYYYASCYSITPYTHTHEVVDIATG